MNYLKTIISFSFSMKPKPDGQTYFKYNHGLLRLAWRLVLRGCRRAAAVGRQLIKFYLILSHPLVEEATHHGLGHAVRLGHQATAEVAIEWQPRGPISCERGWGWYTFSKELPFHPNYMPSNSVHSREFKPQYPLWKATTQRWYYEQLENE